MPQATGCLSLFLQNIAHATDKCCGIKLCAQNVVGAICKNRNSPVANERHTLTGLLSFNAGAEIFCSRNASLAFHIDKYEIVTPGLKHPESFGGVQRGVHIESGDAKDLVAQRSQHLSTAEVKNIRFGGCGFHRVEPLYRKDNSSIVSLNRSKLHHHCGRHRFRPESRLRPCRRARHQAAQESEPAGLPYASRGWSRSRMPVRNRDHA
ncbi:hypothetical protein BDD14_0859 [Edaphobacter modestus]|uniref:Uncharacterized protein n=1 Tax=Edaphobacter modestus TaxID=388466 RepID=A0A4Q7YQP2_9BACT|nr:hypothetical protein BDD14_0859 [Edaphobacter modestus]